MVEAVGRNPRALKFASEELWSDRDFMRGDVVESKSAVLRVLRRG